jgi:hypothetical protein
MKKSFFFLFGIVCICKLSATCQTTTLHGNGTSRGRDGMGKFVSVQKSFLITKEVELKIIKNKFRNIDLRPTDTDSIKIVAKIHLNDSDSMNEQGSWERARIRAKTDGSAFYIEPIITPDIIPAKGGATTLKRGDSDVLFKPDLRRNNAEESIIIYTPITSKILIESEFSNITLSGGFKILDLVCNNCFISIPEIKTVSANLRYSDLMIQQLDSAIIEGKLGTLNVHNGNTLEVSSDVCQIKLGEIKVLKLNSINDDIEIDSIGSFTGNKKNGYLRIKKLRDEFRFTGSASDVSIDKIDQNLKVFDLKNQFAKVDIYLGKLSNYQISQRGRSSNIYSSFQFQKVETESKEVNSYRSPGNNKYGMAINLDCDNCKIFLNKL